MDAKRGRYWDVTKRFFIRLDSGLEAFAVTCLLTMIVIVTVQVFTRKLFNFVFLWSEEITLLCLAWFALMGVAIGFREKLHMSMDLVENFLPKRAIGWLDRFVDICIFAFGLYFIFYGWDFCILMLDSTLPATKMPSTVLYAVMPLTGFMICVYAALHFIGIDTRRYKDIEEEIKGHDA